LQNNAFNSLQLQLDIMDFINDITNVFSVHALSHSSWIDGLVKTATVFLAD